MMGGTGRMKKHKFGLVGIDLEANARKPNPNKGGHIVKFSSNTMEGLTRCKDTSIIHIKGDVRITQATKTQLENRRSKQCRKNGQEGRALWSAAKRSKEGSFAIMVSS